jgi:hypothetical protein
VASKVRSNLHHHLSILDCIAVLSLVGSHLAGLRRLIRGGG